MDKNNLWYFYTLLILRTLLPCKKTWKQAKRISSRRGDVYLLIKNTCSAKMKSMCLALDEQIAIEQMKSDFKVECGVQV